MKENLFMDRAVKPLILFDLVSTITDAGPRYAEAYARMTQTYGLNVPDRDAILQDLGNKNLKQIIADHSPDMPDSLTDKFMSDCNNACDAMLYDVHWVERVFPGVREALEALSKDGYTLGLYTGTREDAMQAQLRYHNLTAYFDAAMLCGKDNARDAEKTPQALKMEQMGAMIATFRARPDHGAVPVIVIGDTVSDQQAAAANGCAFIGFAENSAKAELFAKAGVAATFSHYDHLPALLAVPPQAPQSAAKPAAPSFGL